MGGERWEDRGGKTADLHVRAPEAGCEFRYLSDYKEEGRKEREEQTSDAHYKRVHNRVHKRRRRGTDTHAQTGTQGQEYQLQAKCTASTRAR